MRATPSQFSMDDQSHSLRGFLQRISVTGLLLFNFVAYIACGGGGGGETNPPASGAPVITAQPQSATVTAPATATFSVTASGTTPYRYQWRKNGTAVSGATSDRYTTPATSTSDTGAKFSVVVTNAVSSVTSSEAALTVVITGNKNLMGINLNYRPYSDWVEDRIFADAMKSSRFWGKFGTDTPLDAKDLDANFWPKVASSLCVMDLARNEGTYACSYAGSAHVSPGTHGIGGGSLQNIDYSNSPTRTTFQIVITKNYGAVTLSFDAGITNLKMMRPIDQFSAVSYPEGTKFTTQAMNLIKKFSTLRLMDYFVTNGNNLVNWTDRPLPTDSTYNGGYPSPSTSGYRFVTDPGTSGVLDPTSSSTMPSGGSYEDGIELCNQTNTDLWLNVPTLASDSFVTQLATLVKANLNSNLNVYVEYSNELWNYGFPQAHQNLALAEADVAAGLAPALNPNGDTNKWYWAARRVARRGVEISNLFRSIWTDAAMPGAGSGSNLVVNPNPRVRPILSSQGLEDIGLLYIDQSMPNPPKYYFYGGGGPGYYYPDFKDTTVNSATVWTSNTMSATTWLNSVCISQGVGNIAFGLRRICYEGGPSFDTQNTPVDAVYKAAWGDNQMQQNLVDHIDRAWSASGGDLFMFYASAGDYRWGFTQDIFHLDTPKFRAIDQLNGQQKAAPSVGGVPPFTVNGVDATVKMQYGGYFVPALTGIGARDHDYLVYAFRTLAANGSTPATGPVTVTVDMGPNVAPVLVYCDGFPVSTISVNAASARVGIALGTLSPGLHAFMLKTTDIPQGGPLPWVIIHSLTFTAP